MPAAADRSPPDPPEPAEPGGTLSAVITAILRAADRALARAAQTAAADQDAPGGLDHTTPWHKGGLTCTCNLGPLCET